jgi:hypothetical protein
MRSVPALTPVTRPPQPRLQLRDGHVQRGVTVLGRGLRADDRAARGDGQLDAFLAARLARVALGRDLHIDPDRLLIQLPDLGELRCRVLAEPIQHVRVPASEDDVH